MIPILEREFDDFDTESTRFLAGTIEETDFIKFRLKQGVYGQRQPDVQMVRVKLPMGGVTPDQLDAFADVIEKYVPLRKGHVTTRQNIQMHHVPLPDAAQLIRELGEAGLSSREGCGNTMRNVTGDPRAGVLRGRAVRHHPVRRRLCALLRASSRRRRRCRARSRPRSRPPTRTTRSPASTTWPSSHACATASAGVEIRVGGGTSIMPRIAPDAVRVRRARQRRLPQGHRGVHADLRSPGLPARQSRPRPHQGAGRQDRDRRVPRAGRGGAAGRLGRRARLLARRRSCSSTTRRQRARRPEPRWRRAERRSAARSRTSSSPTCAPASGRASHGRGQDHPRRPDPGAAARPRRRSCATTRAATPGPRCTRTWCCAGSATNRSTTCGAAERARAWARPAPTRSPTSSAAPAPTPASSGITSSMGLNQAVQDAGRGDGDRRSR